KRYSRCGRQKHTWNGPGWLFRLFRKSFLAYNGGMSLRSVACIFLVVFVVGEVPLLSQESERKAPRAEAAEEAETTNAAVEKMSVPEGSVKKVGETLYRIGELEFDAK